MPQSSSTFASPRTSRARLVKKNPVNIFNTAATQNNGDKYTTLTQQVKEIIQRKTIKTYKNKYSNSQSVTMPKPSRNNFISTPGDNPYIDPM